MRLARFLESKGFLCGRRGHHRDVQEVLERMERLMSKLDDLKNALDAEIASATASVNRAVSVMQAAVAALQANNPNSAAIQALLDSVATASPLAGVLNTASDDLQAAVGP